MYRHMLTIDLAGTVDRDALQALRTALRLNPSGRYDDGWDEEMGDRLDEVPGGSVRFELYRDDIDGPYRFRVSVEGEAGDAAVEAVREEIVTAVRESGLDVL